MEVTYQDSEVDADSGKGAGDENFPVGSFLIAAPLRPAVKAYYDFARAADDIGDDPELSAEEKLRRLEAYRQVLHGEAEGLSRPRRLREALLKAGIPLERGSDLLLAFKQDAEKPRYENLDQLLGYCRNSANPVGQFLLDLHGEDRRLFPASDALCTSLQILNHLQDMKDDLREIDRCYLPQDWMADEGAATDDLLAERSSHGLTNVRMRLLHVCRDLNETAERLVRELKSRRLASESAVTLRLAKRLTERLTRQDPLAERVALSKADMLAAGAMGLAEGALGQRRAA
ncbi:squalene synthase HpnC [Parvularcula maris]|uniref:Squalene synthase HpnC n=1 Tax=Parvularcula maris TaxID=2965077 RepID=A0A9X2L650_9PROT|nr:squalene synthase HpnC [Parvularcula maris]